MQDSWLSAKADEIQKFADRNDAKRFYEALRSLYGPQLLGSSPLLDSSGATLITEKTLILQLWAEHFHFVLNRPSTINNEAIDRIPQVDMNYSLDALPSEAETSQATNQCSSGKAPVSDAIPAEVYKAGRAVLVEKLTQLFRSFWKQGSIPQKLKGASIVHLYKRKGNRQVCNNYRGISLLSVAGKIFARVLLNHLIDHLEQGILPEIQCGFRKERGTVDMIFAARQLQEKCQEQNCEPYATFVDLTKAFDTVSCEGLWRIMSKFGCPDRFILMVRQFHDGMVARVLSNRSEQEMQVSMDKFTATCDNFGLFINTKKTEVMYQPAPKAQYQEPTITVKGQKLHAVDQFTYLGSTLSRAVTIDIEVNCRIANLHLADCGLTCGTAVE
ncbi:RNA-directed DNA polymerase from mobile element jockey-like [Crotalus adamanteus]|uniref:RNA-directed DNA polymerase from mobile element jockey-like n=1 Tax=Crotalus adamanteus TaxID=8729 RepID=A0AAW1BI25_CROAD